MQTIAEGRGGETRQKQKRGGRKWASNSSKAGLCPCLVRPALVTVQNIYAQHKLLIIFKWCLHYYTIRYYVHDRCSLHIVHAHCFQHV